jgi:hypothetical protein
VEAVTQIANVFAANVMPPTSAPSATARPALVGYTHAIATRPRNTPEIAGHAMRQATPRARSRRLDAGATRPSSPDPIGKARRARRATAPCRCEAVIAKLATGNDLHLSVETDSML